MKIRIRLRPKVAEQKEIKTIGGIRIPDIETEKFEEDEPIDERRMNVTYPLIPWSPRRGDKVYCYVRIYFDEETNELVYNVIEQKLDKSLSGLLENIKEYIQEKIDVDFLRIKKREGIRYLSKLFDEALRYFKANYDENTKDVLRYYAFRDFLGLGIIEPLLNDKFIEDISCDGVNINIYVYHRDPRVGSLRTNIVFKTRDELDSFVNKLAERCGRSISVAKPLLDGTLPEGQRIQATLGSDIAKHGSNFTIRMFTEKPLTPVDIIRFGTCDIKMMAFFWYLIENGSSFLISGGTATGKTSFLNVLSMFIKPQMKIVSIEDTEELRLPHYHWISEVARTPISEEGKVDMFELLRESLRQRPDYIIVGEVRGKEAYVLFQQMAVGHPGLSTIHSENFPKLIDRLTSPPINLSANLIQNLDLLVFLKRIKSGKRYMRKVQSVLEVVGYDRERKIPITNRVLQWEPKGNKFLIKNESMLLKKIADATGLSPKLIQDEIRQRARVIEFMIKRNIKDYKEVGKLVRLFYSSPDYLMERIEEI